MEKVIEKRFLDTQWITNFIDYTIIDIRDNQGTVLCNKCNSDKILSHTDEFGSSWQCHGCRELIYNCTFLSKTHKPELTKKDLPRVVDTIFPEIINRYLYEFIQYTLPSIDFKKLKKMAVKKIQKRFALYLIKTQGTYDHK